MLRNLDRLGEGNKKSVPQRDLEDWRRPRSGIQGLRNIRRGGAQGREREAPSSLSRRSVKDQSRCRQKNWLETFRTRFDVPGKSASHLDSAPRHYPLAGETRDKAYSRDSVKRG